MQRQAAIVCGRKKELEKRRKAEALRQLSGALPQPAAAPAQPAPAAARAQLTPVSQSYEPRDAVLRQLHYYFSDANLSP